MKTKKAFFVKIRIVFLILSCFFLHHALFAPLVCALIVILQIYSM